MAKAVVTARVDEKIKEKASAVLTSMSLTVSDALRMLLVAIARESALPFELLVPNQKTIDAIMEAENGQMKSFKTVQKLMDDLKTEGD